MHAVISGTPKNPALEKALAKFATASFLKKILEIHMAAPRVTAAATALIRRPMVAWVVCSTRKPLMMTQGRQR